MVNSCILIIMYMCEEPLIIIVIYLVNKEKKILVAFYNVFIKY